MVVAEILTGIALVKQATDFIKSNINTVKDIGQMAKDKPQIRSDYYKYVELKREYDERMGMKIPEKKFSLGDMMK